MGLELVTVFGFAALLGLAGMVLSALARPAWVPLVIAGGGLLALAVAGFNQMNTPCTSDAAGCGMSTGYAMIALWLCGAPLLAGALAAIGWRIAAGTEAPLATRAAALAVAFVVLACAMMYLLGL